MVANIFTLFGGKLPLLALRILRFDGAMKCHETFPGSVDFRIGAWVRFPIVPISPSKYGVYTCKYSQKGFGILLMFCDSQSCWVYTDIGLFP